MHELVKSNYKTWIRKYGIVGVILLLSVLFTSLNRVFISSGNIMNIVRQASVNIIMACGLTFVIVGGTMDTSIGAQAGLAGMICALMMSNGIAIPVSILCAILIIIGFGAFNGFLIQKFNLAPLIVTLGTMNLATGISNLLSNGKSIYNLPMEFAVIGRGFVGVIPIPVIIMFVIVVITSIVLSKTLFGRRTFAIGGNETVAKLSGINLMFYRIIFYMLSSLMAAIGGIIMTSRLASGMPDLGANISMDILTAVVIGGSMLGGGSGSIIGSVLGALLLTIISNGFNINRVNTYWQMVISAVILIAVIIANRRKD